jgi:glycosyltransferase involved in cell wall biosynthesis
MVRRRESSPRPHRTHLTYVILRHCAGRGLRFPLNEAVRRHAVKIAILANNYGEPWAEGGKNNVRHVALALGKRHEVFVAGLGPETDRRIVDGLPVFRYRSPGYENRFARLGYPLGYLNLILRGRSLIRAERPDVIFSYFETASTALVSVGLRKLALPASTLLHTVWSDWFTPTLLPVSHWMSELVPQLALNSRFASRLGLMGVDRILATSGHLERQVESLGRKATFTPTGVDTHRFRPKPEIRERKAAGEFRVGYVGHFTYTKGVSLLLEAFAGLAEVEPGARLVLAAAGDFEESSVVRGSRHPRIEQLGFVDTPEAFNSFDLTVLPRRYSYGTASYPNVVLESMACGTPVLTARLPAIEEIITDGVDGFLFRPNDLGDLRAKLQQLARDPELLLRAGVKARERALSLDWSRVLPAVLEEVERCPSLLRA